MEVGALWIATRRFAQVRVAVLRRPVASSDLLATPGQAVNCLYAAPCFLFSVIQHVRSRRSLPCRACVVIPRDGNLHNRVWLRACAWTLSHTRRCCTDFPVTCTCGTNLLYFTILAKVFRSFEHLRTASPWDTDMPLRTPSSRLPVIPHALQQPSAATQPYIVTRRHRM
jgi:hypothetical protein